MVPTTLKAALLDELTTIRPKRGRSARKNVLTGRVPDWWWKGLLSMGIGGRPLTGG
jgi:hypothetical protein